MPIGLGLVRIGNFLNGELYGRPTDSEWGFIFPTDPFGLLRHPSQLYESFGEGILLFVILMIVNKLTKINGVISSCFLISSFIGFLASKYIYFNLSRGYYWGRTNMRTLLYYIQISMRCNIFFQE